MELNNMDFVRLLPLFMRDDDANIGLSNAVNVITEKLSERARLCSTWDKIDDMSEAELDLLADELNISWYDKKTTIDIKRKIIRESDIVHSKLGTNWAAKQVINTYFGEGEIIDWYTYGGEPGHFKIQTLNQSIMEEKYSNFISILNKVKRKSAVLDSIELILDGNLEINSYLAATTGDLVTTFVMR